MITKLDYLSRGHELLKYDDTREGVKELFLSFFKKENIDDATFFIPSLYKILFKPEKIFFDGRFYDRNPELEQKVKKEFIEFFLRDYINDFLKLYPKVKEEKYINYKYFLAIIIRYIAVAKPRTYYFNALALILIDVLISEEDISYHNIALKGLARYYINLDMFKNLIAENIRDIYKDISNKTSVYEEMKDIFIHQLERFGRIIFSLNIDENEKDIINFWILNKCLNKKLLSSIRQNINLEKLFNNSKYRLEKIIDEYSLQISKEKIFKDIEKHLKQF